MKDTPENETAGPKADVYEIITGHILAALAKGVVPWQKPWNFTGGESSDMPRNYASKKAYNGLNVWLLLSRGYDCPCWLSFKQAKEAGGMVRKGEKGTPIVFWKCLPKLRDGKPVFNGNGKPEMVFFLRYYTVFNVLQCDGIKWEAPAKVVAEPFKAIEACAAVVVAMPNAPAIKHGGNRACYSPGLDSVGMPEATAFKAPSGYYATLFHELAHSTGHKSRLHRKGFDGDEGAWQSFGSASYAKEELVAEMGAAFLCGHTGIVNETIDNSAAYIANWKARLTEDSKLVVMAAAQAQKAADYIRGVKKEIEAE